MRSTTAEGTTRADLDEAVRAAHMAFELAQGFSPHRRAGWLESIAEALDSAADQAGVVTLAPGGDGEAPAPTLLARTVDGILKLFGPASMVVPYDAEEQLVQVAGLLTGQLPATVHGEDEDASGDLIALLKEKAGRVIWNAWPTGVTVSCAQQHGGPYRVTTAPGTTSVDPRGRPPVRGPGCVSGLSGRPPPVSTTGKQPLGYRSPGRRPVGADQDSPTGQGLTHDQTPGPSAARHRTPTARRTRT